MFKKFKKIFNKQTVIAFMLGALLFSGIPVMANVTEYIFTQSNCKLLIDGQEYNNPDIPIVLFMKDSSNFAPLAVLRDLCNKLGIPFEYDNDTKEIRITTTGVTNTGTNNTDNTNIIGKEENVLSESITTIETTTEETLIINDTEYEENGLTIREIGEDKYVEYDDIKGKLENTKYKLDYIIGRTYCSLFKENSDDKYEKIVEEINIYNHKFSPSKYRQLFKNNIMYLEYNDYVSIIKPLIGE
jgi:hypothetical protein